MNNNQITFGITTYIKNPERIKYLNQCINSILKQTNPNREIIISDDNSPLGFNFGDYKENKKIKIYKQKKNLGIFKGFNFCLEKCSTKRFIPMGDDDLINPNFVEKVFEVINKHKDIDIIYFNHENIDSNGNIYLLTKNKLKEGFINIKNYNNLDNLLRDSPTSFFSVINSKKLKDLGGYPDYGMTTDGYLAFFYYINFNGYFLEENLAKLRRHKDNASGSRSVLTFMEERLILIDIILKDFGKNLTENGINFLLKQKENIKYSHIGLMKIFNNKGRLEGLKFSLKHFKKEYLGIKYIIILFLGIIMGKHIQTGFNIISDIYELLSAFILSFIYSK